MDLTVAAPSQGREKQGGEGGGGEVGGGGDLAETDCWLEETVLFLFFSEWRGAVQWGHKGLNMSTETVRTECVCVGV